MKKSAESTASTRMHRPDWIAEQGHSIWCVNDPRSVGAMLRGRGDGREKLYLQFCEFHRAQNPRVTEDELHQMYSCSILRTESINSPSPFSLGRFLFRWILRRTHAF